jgi:hypothetical protein
MRWNAKAKKRRTRARVCAHATRTVQNMSRGRTSCGGLSAFTRLDTDGQVNGDLTVTGNATVSDTLTTRNLLVTNSWQTSDSRLKTLTADCPVSAPDGTVCPRLAAQLLMRLPARTYFMGNQLQIGHFAQEVRKLLPTAVREDAATTRLSLNYNDLHVLGTCVAADAWKRARDLEQRLARAEAVVAAVAVALAFFFVALVAMWCDFPLVHAMPRAADEPLCTTCAQTAPLQSALIALDATAWTPAPPALAPCPVDQPLQLAPLTFLENQSRVLCIVQLTSLSVLFEHAFDTTTIVMSFVQPYFCAP